jgi:formylglycine-generating enzyme required for sulfatase activity
MGWNPSFVKGKNNPVEKVSWDDAQEFCMKVSQSTAQPLHLPTEAEWEYACRAGTKTVYYAGDTEADLDRAGWYNGNSKNTTHSVGGTAPNAWGLYDMHGNVWEWCQDWHEKYRPEAQVDPQGPLQATYCVIRGGSWTCFPRDCRAAFRDWYLRHLASDAGFRVVVSVAPRAP